MPLYKVKISQGAFINDTLIREDEIVELPKGTNPNWGVLCKEDGTELESMSDKVAAQDKIEEHLAKSIEGKDTNEVTKKLAKENAELHGKVDQLTATVEKLLEAQQLQTSDGESGSVEPTPEHGVDPAIASQAKAIVDMLEDSEDSHWTSRGEPKLDVIKAQTGQELSRAQLDAINDRRRIKPAA